MLPVTIKLFLTPNSQQHKQPFVFNGFHINNFTSQHRSFGVTQVHGSCVTVLLRNTLSPCCHRWQQQQKCNGVWQIQTAATQSPVYISQTPTTINCALDRTTAKMENWEKVPKAGISNNHSENVTATVFSERHKDYQYLLENTGHLKNPYHPSYT